MRALSHADDVVDAAHAVSAVADVAQAANEAENVLDAVKALDNVDEATDFLRAVPIDQVGTSQPFKLRAGEDGLSVFENVSQADVLAELPGGRVPNTTVTIPQSALPAGTTVRPTLAPGLSEYLSNAHRVLVRPEGWSADRFAKVLKQIVGWE